MSDLSNLYQISLPEVAPVFPLSGTILLPRSELPLNIFEQRYIDMVDHALATNRMIVMVQPKKTDHQVESLSDLNTTGCIGKITTFQESDDGRYLISLTGLRRCNIAHLISDDNPFLSARLEFGKFLQDHCEESEKDIDRARLISTLKVFLHTRNYEADWSNLSKASIEAIVNAFSLFLPFDAQEKQGLLEAISLKERTSLIIALMEMALAQDMSSETGTVQ